MPTNALPDPLISPEALAKRLDAPDIRIMDASWGPPGAPRDRKAEFALERIPGALFFDLEDLSDRDDPIPLMLPPPEKFSSRMRRMGVGDGATIVVYDTDGIFAAARAWWMFRVMGKEDVFVLDGGLPAWKAAGLPLEDGPPSPRAERHFTARKRADLVRNFDDMRRASESKSAQILDARGPGRFSGAEPEPRPGVRGGHIPGAMNLHYADLLDHGRMKDVEALQALFADRRVELRKPAFATCGSGVSAAIIALAFARLGRWDVPVYDGSWGEWGARADAPIETGA